MDVIAQPRWTKPFGLVLTMLISLGVLVMLPGGAVHAAPPLAEDDPVATDEDTPVTIDVLANDTDADGDPLTVTDIDGAAIAEAVPVVIESGASVSIESDGTLTYDPNGRFEGLAEAEGTTDTFDYTVSDGTDVASATVTIDLTGVDDPLTAGDDIATTDEDSTILIAVLANDADPDTDTVPTIATVLGEPFTVGTPITLPSDAIVTVNADGTLTYDPSGNFADLGPGESSDESFEYAVADDNGGTATATVTITVVGVNHAPTAVDDEVNVEVNRATTIDVVANDSDIDGDPFTAALVDPPEHGTALCTADGECTYTPDDGYTGADVFTYSIVDIVTPSQFKLESTASVIIVVGVVTSPTSLVVRRELPATGNETGPMTTIALVAFALGLVLLGVSRRGAPL